LRKRARDALTTTEGTTMTDMKKKIAQARRRTDDRDLATKQGRPPLYCTAHLDLDEDGEPVTVDTPGLIRFELGDRPFEFERYELRPFFARLGIPPADEKAVPTLLDPSHCLSLRSGPGSGSGRSLAIRQLRSGAADLLRTSPGQRLFSWEGQDSNLRRLRRRFYRPLPLAARAPSRARAIEARSG
jgi:hypothetical protein